MGPLLTLLFLLLYTQNSAQNNPFSAYNNNVNADINNSTNDALDAQSGNPFAGIGNVNEDTDGDDDNESDPIPITAVQRFDAKQAEEQEKISNRHWSENSKRGKYQGDSVCHVLINYLTQSGTNCMYISSPLMSARIYTFYTYFRRPNPQCLPALLCE